jgi:ribosomal protein S18 acetylase RimI-like enzyme
MQEVTATGPEALALATRLLQRARLADPVAGLWEAADVQWWWRRPRPSDAAEKLFWLDARGPVAGVLLTCWGEDAWQCDPVSVPGAKGPQLDVLWTRALEQAARHAGTGFEVAVRDDDLVAKELAAGAGLLASRGDATAWLEAGSAPQVPALPDGFTLVDRAQRPHAPHPMRARNGQEVGQRLLRCSLYDPALDLAILTGNGQVAGYSLYWFDPVTKVGLVEPVRIMDEFQRRGLARAMLAAGLQRLAQRGAKRMKVSYETDAAAALYEGLGFRRESTTSWYRASVP